MFSPEMNLLMATPSLEVVVNKLIAPFARPAESRMRNRIAAIRAGLKDGTYPHPGAVAIAVARLMDEITPDTCDAVSHRERTRLVAAC